MKPAEKMTNWHGLERYASYKTRTVSNLYLGIRVSPKKLGTAQGLLNTKICADLCTAPTAVLASSSSFFVHLTTFSVAQFT